MIDPPGELDEFAFQGARSLSEAVANHPKLPGCLVETLYGSATGHTVVEGELGLADDLTEAFVGSGHDVRKLLGAIAWSEGFRRVGPIPNEHPATEFPSRNGSRRIGGRFTHQARRRNPLKERC